MATASASARRVRRPSGNFLSDSTLLLISIFCVVPFFGIFLSSFNGDARLFLDWPEQWTLDNYTRVFTVEDGGLWLFNSLFIVGSATILVVVLGGFGGYALSRTRAWWKLPFLYGILLIRVLPPTALVVPLYTILLTLSPRSYDRSSAA